MDQRAHYLAKLAYERGLRDRNLTAAQRRHPKKTIEALQKTIAVHNTDSDALALVDDHRVDLRQYRPPSILELPVVSDGVVDVLVDPSVEASDPVQDAEDDEEINIDSLLPSFAKDSVEDEQFISDLYEFESGQWRSLH